jgi:hypothetical protein
MDEYHVFLFILGFMVGAVVVEIAMSRRIL